MLACRRACIIITSTFNCPLSSSTSNSATRGGKNNVNTLWKLRKEQFSKNGNDNFFKKNHAYLPRKYQPRAVVP